MTARMPTRAIGAVEVSAIGLGCAGLSLEHAGDPRRGVRTIRAALDAGVTLFDTAAAYTPRGEAHHNERLLGRALGAAAGAVFVATKGGHHRVGDAFDIDARPATLRADVESSLAALGTERIDLYLLHHPDPRVPIEDSVAALDDLRRAGRIARIGLSNVDAAQLDRAARVAPIAAVQNPLSVFDRGHGDLLDRCARDGIAFLAHSPLGGAGRIARGDLPAGLVDLAHRYDMPPARVALAWLLARSPAVVPVVGASRPAHVRDAVRAADRWLPAAELDRLGPP